MRQVESSTFSFRLSHVFVRQQDRFILLTIVHLVWPSSHHLQSRRIMATPSAFFLGIEGGAGDSPTDANSLLVELDKGLRSTHRGEQCEAIVRFPWLLERYPFPILVNSASLRLADVFRNGSNFCRLLILRVLHQANKHLDKISNCDEFVRRIFSVIYSNDPVARALTLKTLAAISSMAYDRKNIHHCIRDSLDSHDEVEVSAAIDAAAAYAKHSKEFALNMYPKALAMIHGLETEPALKIKLLSVLHHDHYDSILAQEVSSRLEELLTSHPSEKFVCSVLHTLSFVCSSSLVHIQRLIHLLFNFFTIDHRKEVCDRALQEIYSVAKSSPHLWSRDNVDNLVSCTEAYFQKLSCEPSTVVRSRCTELLRIIGQLLKCPSLLFSERQKSQELFKRVAKLAISVTYDPQDDLTSISIAFQILTSLCVTHGRDVDCLNDTLCAVQAFIHSRCTSPLDTSSEKMTSPNAICKSFVQLCRLSDDSRSQVMTSLRFVLLNNSLTNSWLIPISETLCSINDSSGDGTDFIHDLESLLSSPEKDSAPDDIIVRLMTVYFQTLVLSGGSVSIDILSCLKGRSHWTVYRTTRQALRFGHHSIAKTLCEHMLKKCSSETTTFWFSCLSKISCAESFLTSNPNSEDIECRLRKTISLYTEALSCLRVAMSSSSHLSFQEDYLHLRLKTLQAHECLRQACKLSRSSPAPAIAAAAAMNARDDLLKYGAIVNQMRKASKEFRSLSESFSQLFQSSFNADNTTLAHLQLQQSSCTMIAEAIESLFQINRMSSLLVDKNTHLEIQSATGPSAEQKKLIEVCHRMSFNVSQQLTGRSTSKLDGSHIELLSSMGLELLSVPLSLPRLFFQAVQNTSLRLALSPQPKIQDSGVIGAFVSNAFVLKVEGVIVTSEQANRQLTRNVSKVMLVATTMSTRTEIIGSTVSCVVSPKKEYFQTQFTLNFPNAGLHTITVEASIIDENDAQWKTGPVATCQVQVHDDGVK